MHCFSLNLGFIFVYKSLLKFYYNIFKVVEKEVDLIVMGMFTGCDFKDHRQLVIALTNLLGSSTLLDEVPFPFSSANGTLRRAKRLPSSVGYWPYEIKVRKAQVSTVMVMEVLEVDAAHESHLDFYRWIAEHYDYAFYQGLILVIFYSTSVFFYWTTSSQ